MNKLFKSSNTLLSTLNTGYWVCKRNDFAEEKVANLYDVYISPEGGGLDYFFSVTAKPTMKKSVIFNDKSYTDVDQLITDVTEYNKTLAFPSRCYDPMTLPYCNEERKIHWYLTNVIGMKMNWESNYSTYRLNNSMGDEIVCISFDMDYRTDGEKNKYSTSGRIVRGIHNAWVSLSFSNAEEAVSQINSLVSTQLIVDVNSGIEVLTRLSDSFSSLKDAEIQNIDMILSGQKEKYRDKVLPILRQLIEKFESD